MTPEGVTSVYELDERVSAGIQVRLMYSAHEACAFVTVLDLQSGESFCLEVGAEESAHDVFHHPYAYSAARLVAPVTREELAAAPSGARLR